MKNQAVCCSKGFEKYDKSRDAEIPLPVLRQNEPGGERQLQLLPQPDGQVMPRLLGTHYADTAVDSLWGCCM